MSTVVHMSAQLTLTEVAKRTLNGQMLPIAEILNKSRPIIQHMQFVEANDQFSNVTTQRYNIPAGSWRTFNAGVLPETGQTKQIRDTIGMLESYAEHDCKLVDSMPSPAQFRNDENGAFIEGLSQTMAYQAFYGNAQTAPNKWTGLAPRLNTLNSKTVQGCGGSGGDTSSIFLVMWGPTLCHMVYPRGSSAGLKHENLGKATKVDSSGYMWEVYRDHFMWDCGMVVKNPRAIARIANIEVSGSSNIFDEDVLIRVKNWMVNQGRGAVGYCSTNVMSQVMIAIKDKSNVFHPVSDPFGPSEVPSLLGIPLYVDENIIETETVVS
jgi:hypothetical protein